MLSMRAKPRLIGPIVTAKLTLLRLGVVWLNVYLSARFDSGIAFRKLHGDSSPNFEPVAHDTIVSIIEPSVVFCLKPSVAVQSWVVGSGPSTTPSRRPHVIPYCLIFGL
ncbi:Uncharacterised protein [Burkholderia pseudomallei]|nr:Uncharacterised protein [Burkholderia pseudomallei]